MSFSFSFRHRCKSMLTMFSKSSDAEEMAFNVTQWVNDSRPFRICNHVHSDEATDKLRQKTTWTSHAMADLVVIILEALPDVLDEVDPSTKHERMLARQNREQAQISLSEGDRKARQNRLEKRRLERERRRQKLVVLCKTHRPGYWQHYQEGLDHDEREPGLRVEDTPM